MARLLAFLLLVAPAAAQVSVPPRGADATFDVAAWNVLFFGSTTQGVPPAAQVARVEAVIEQAAVDLWALQEVVTPAAFADLLARLADAADDPAYAGVLGPPVSTSAEFDLRLAFVYNPDVVTVLSTRSVTEVSSGNFGGRRPFEMRARVRVGDAEREVLVVALHAKAGSSASDYADRAAGAAQLKTYLDGRVAAGEAVILAGDFNDRLFSSITSGQSQSPYAAFAADARYTLVTAATEQAGLATFCGRGNNACAGTSTIDHIVFAGLDATFLPDGGAERQRYGELTRGPQAIPSYTTTVSDHLPVLARFALAPVAADGPAADLAGVRLAAAPSPFGSATEIRLTLDAPEAVRVEVVDALGRRVAVLADGPLAAGAHTLRLDGRGLAPGVYGVRLATPRGAATLRVVRR